MPYKSIKDINPALKGLRPPVSLDQANLIAGWADEIEKGGTVKAPWAVAIAQFKKAYTVRQGKWVERKDKEKSESAELETGQDLGVQGAGVAEGDYYPEEMPTYIPGSVRSFAALRQLEQADETAHEIREKAGQFVGLLNNILWAPDVTDKISAMSALWDEFISEIQSTIQSGAAGQMESKEAGQDQANTSSAAETKPDDGRESIAETYAVPGGVEIIEEAGANADPAKPLMMDVQIIRPGWGNSRDNHYYPADMLRKNAEKFIGAKMYESDHRPAEKSNRTWVSTIQAITGFTDDGAPIARVAVHDPGFAERARNLKAAGLLDKLECSILADGIASPVEIGGKRGKSVDSIESVAAVDWVTRAGAGGHALDLVESAEGAAEGASSEEKPGENPGNLDTPAMVAAVETAPEKIGIEESKIEEAPGPVMSVPADKIAEILGGTRLPAVSRGRLAAGVYATETALREAISAEVSYIKALTGAGRPSDFGPSAAAVVTPSLDAAERMREEAVDRIFNLKGV